MTGAVLKKPFVVSLSNHEPLALDVTIHSPLFEKDDCTDATTKGWSMDRGTTPRMGEVELRLEQQSRAPTVGALGDAWSGCREQCRSMNGIRHAHPE